MDLKVDDKYLSIETDPSVWDFEPPVYESWMTDKPKVLESTRDRELLARNKLEFSDLSEIEDMDITILSKSLKPRARKRSALRTSTGMGSKMSPLSKTVASGSKLKGKTK